MKYKAPSIGFTFHKASKEFKMRNKLQKVTALLLVFVFLTMGTFGAEAQGSGPEGMTNFYSVRLKGGYVASGVGLRNLGKGTIILKGIPRGAKVYRAFLYWNIMDNMQKARNASLRFRGNPVVGTYVGGDHDSCWLPDTMSSFSYRADVTRYVKGNGKYLVSGVASALTNGSDPWSAPVKAPLAQGASLVVIYQKSTYPYTKFLIWDGAVTVPETTDPYVLTMGTFPAATDPVGPSKTTFIVADGQTGTTDYATVNSTTLPGFHFEGKDRRNGASYSLGNLWDTRTTYIGRYMNPGNTTVNIGLGSGADCLTWVAQVLSTSRGNIDTDRDKLLDGWEATGYDDNGDGIIDVDLPAMGASPFHKDIFVEHDWMLGDSVHDHYPSDTVLNRVRNSFAAAPVSNPDGRNGITLHNVRSNAIQHANDISAGCDSASIWAGFDLLKNTNFNPIRRKIFHYVIWAHDICPGLGSTSGISRGIPASDFLVTLGSWSTPGGTANQRTGTFMHELGHNLGLYHGGNAGDNKNYKPNHLSIMNYSFQVIGVWRSGARRWDYTRMTINRLDERNLNEFTGLNGSGNLAPYGTTFYCGTAARNDNTADTNVNWNCNRSIELSVATDINKDGAKNILGTVRNQWTHLVYNGGDVGFGAPADLAVTADQMNSVPCLREDDLYDINRGLEH